jgi:undecaprenyl-diphosphatase
VYVFVGIIFSFLTYVMASFAYKSLSFFPIPYFKMLLIQLSSSFASKLAPAGAGGLAVNARFLTKYHHTLIQAGSIAAINNVMGFVGHMSILVVLILFGSTSVSEAFNFRITVPPWVWLVGGGFFVFAVATLNFMPSLRKKIVKTIVSAKDTFVDYKRHPARLFGSYVASVLLTLSYAGALYMSALALGASLSLIQVIVVFTVGVAAASVTPTPGGIGGAEAGLAAALTGTGMTADLAISIALLYRLITYWLPIIPGLICFQYSVKKEYI